MQRSLGIDIRGLGIGIDARTSYAAFAASFLSAVKAASEIYPILHGDIVDGNSIPYVEDFCKCVGTISPAPSSLARYHSAASPEASAALLAVPKTQQMTFPKQAFDDDDDDVYIYSFDRTTVALT